MFGVVEMVCMTKRGADLHSQMSCNLNTSKMVKYMRSRAGKPCGLPMRCSISVRK